MWRDPRRETMNDCDVVWKTAKQVIVWELCDITNEMRVHVKNMRVVQLTDVKKPRRRWRLRKADERR